MEAVDQILQHDCTSTGSNTASESEESTISNVAKIRSQRRRPTRRPDPNVQNRNALLARENRRKKKEHLEAMEKELEEVRATNKRLHKALKQQMKTVGQLQNEKRYFQGIIANHKEIHNLIKALNVRMHIQQLSTANSPMLNSSPEQSNNCQQLRSSPNIFQQHNPIDAGAYNNSNDVLNVNSTSDLSENGSVGVSEGFYNPTVSMSLFNNFDNFFSDFGYSSTFTDAWSDLLDEDVGTKDLTQLTKVADEHSYADVGLMQSPTSTDTDAGICLHIRQGKISLEFCPSCSLNSNDSIAANLF